MNKNGVATDMMASIVDLEAGNYRDFGFKFGKALDATANSGKDELFLY